MKNNLLLNCDSYKASHWLQYPPGTEYVYSYIESRGGEYDEVLFFGLQAFIKEYLSVPFTKEDIEEAEEFWVLHGEPFNKEGWEYILEKHKGFLPVMIEAIPEGSVLPTKIPMVTIVNTDPKCFWVTSFIETALLRAVWYPTTVATVSYHCKKIIKKYLDLTGDPEIIAHKLHDFGSRGVSSQESAMLGGMAHLVNFTGSDTVVGVLGARKYYGERMAGFSIPAAEHSTITSWGKSETGEIAAYRNMLKQYATRESLLAVVSDSYDIFNACEYIWGEILRQEVIDSEAMVIIRPDSGDPEETTIRVCEILAEKFGTTTNEKGFKVLNNVAIIQGDGVNPVSIENILKRFMNHGFSADNIAFGMGGALLQKLDRDTLKFAMKCSAININGGWLGVSKSPVGQPDKASKEGRFEVFRSGGEWGWKKKDGPNTSTNRNLLSIIYDGVPLVENYENFTTIRERTNFFLDQRE